MSGKDDRTKVGIGDNIATLFRRRMATLGINAAVESFLRGESLKDFMSSSTAKHIFTPEAIEMIENGEFPKEFTYESEPCVPCIQTEVDTKPASSIDTIDTAKAGLGAQIVSTHQKEEDGSSRKLVRKTGRKGIIIPSDS